MLLLHPCPLSVYGANIDNMYKVSLVQINDQNNIILPLAIGMLWSYATTNKFVKEKFQLENVVYSRDNIDHQAELLSQSDIVCFSNYLWNFKYQLALAKKIKKNNPKVFIIMGGPSMTTYKKDFWLLNRKWVDFAIIGEGEDSFVKFLLSYPNIDNNIPGSWSPSHTTNLPERIQTFLLDTSPYLTGFYDSIIKNIDKNIQAVIQTNRGCPYHCNFCEEGADYKNKIFEFDMERIKKELDWCAINKIEYLSLADDNFGILPRDIEIMQYIIELKKQYGYPKILDVTFAKNATERVFEIAKMNQSSNADLLRGITVALQSLNTETLEGIERFNLDMIKLKKYVNDLKSIDMPTYTELIWPLPHETYDSFCNGVDNTISIGLDNWAGIYPLHANYGNNIDARYLNDFKFSKQQPMAMTMQEYAEEVNLVYETTWASNKDVVAGNVLYMWLTALYFFGFGRVIIEHIKENYNCSVAQTINSVMKYCQKNPKTFIGKIHLEIQSYWYNWLQGDTATNLSIFSNEDTSYWYAFSHFASRINANREEFFDNIDIFLTTEFPKVDPCVIEIAKHGVIDRSKTYPYYTKIGNLCMLVEKTHSTPEFNNDFEFCQYYYIFKRKNGWHRTQISVIPGDPNR